MFMDVPMGAVGQDMVFNGEAYGDVASTMLGCRFDPGYLRPYVDPQDGQKYVTLNIGTGRDPEEVPVKDLIYSGHSSPVFNATLALRKDEWRQMDQVVVKAARKRLRAWTDLSAANSYGGFNGMNRMVLEHETMSDPGEAMVDMDGLSEGRSDAPLFQLEGLPLPITHSNFWFSSRKLAVSRNGGMPLDTSMGEAAGRRVAEAIEQTTIGTLTGIIAGDGSGIYTHTNTSSGTAPQVFGYTNYPDRVTKTDLTASASFVGTTFVTEVLAMMELLRGQNFYGPYMCYVSTAYDAHLDDDYKAASDKTVRQRLREIDDIREVRRLDYLTGDVVILVQMSPEVARAVNGMDVTTVQWESKGGMQLNFKVMAIQVPQIRSDYSGNCGICHGTTS